jgi:hypothetical protein
VRLALVAMFARRGVNVPMVLDDVLVNFDVARAQRAAEVLSDFAAAGHQVLFFTCHEHIWEMFRKHEADCRRLPARRGLPEAASVAPPAVEAPAPAAAPRSKPKRKPAKRKRRPAAVAAAVAAPTWFDYPFEERLVAEPKVEPEPQAPAWCEYSFEESLDGRRPDDHELALAYIVGGPSSDEASIDARRSRSRRTIIGRTTPRTRMPWDEGDLRPRSA